MNIRKSEHSASRDAPDVPVDESFATTVSGLISTLGDFIIDPVQYAFESLRAYSLEAVSGVVDIPYSYIVGSGGTTNIGLYVDESSYGQDIRFAGSNDAHLSYPTTALVIGNFHIDMNGDVWTEEDPNNKSNIFTMVQRLDRLERMCEAQRQILDTFLKTRNFQRGIRDANR